MAIWVLMLRSPVPMATWNAAVSCKIAYLASRCGAPVSKNVLNPDIMPPEVGATIPAVTPDR